MKLPDVSRQLAAALRAMLDEFQSSYADDAAIRLDDWHEPRAMQRARKALAAYEAARKRRAVRARKGAR